MFPSILVENLIIALKTANESIDALPWIGDCNIDLRRYRFAMLAYATCSIHLVRSPWLLVVHNFPYLKSRLLGSIIICLTLRLRSPCLLLPPAHGLVCYSLDL